MPESAAMRMMPVVAVTAVEVAASMMAPTVVTSTMVSSTVMTPAVVAASVMASAMMAAPMASGRGGNRHTQGSDYGRRKRKTPHHGGILTGLFLGKCVPET
jgi:hypothetical protein